jgi:hypothetical protein
MGLIEGSIPAKAKDIPPSQLSHTPAAIRAAFDDPNLITERSPQV